MGPHSLGVENTRLEAARQRITAAYDPALLKAAGERLAALLETHVRGMLSSKNSVLSWEEPARKVARASQYLSAPGIPAVKTGAVKTRVAELFETMLGEGLNLHDPRYIGHQVPASIPLAGLFDAVGAVTNQVMAIYEMGPWASAVEWALVEKLGAMIGWEEATFSGLITHGGSLANLTALLTARNVARDTTWKKGGLENAVILAHADAHYSVTRAAGILGIGTENVIPVALDTRRKMDPGALDRILTQVRRNRRTVVAVVACACATPIGAFDTLPEISEICRRHDVWLHVDAAHGGAACFSTRYRYLVAGLKNADSVVWDAHKMLFMPALCAFVFYRDKRHRFDAFQQNAPYLFDPSAPGLADYDSGLRTVECTKRAAGFALWGIWALYGPGLFADLVDVTFDTARLFHEKLVAAPDFEPLHEPECNILAFRHVPSSLRGAEPERVNAFQMELRRTIVESGEFYIVSTIIDGSAALRVTVINPLTSRDHLDLLLDTLRAKGEALLNR